ncbi:MAG: hypothetical protein KDD69_04090 [Bdellovibrionales bacterium]|nr:hypothetical protein [Bdellovibrionales bacterium]
MDVGTEAPSAGSGLTSVPSTQTTGSLRQLEPISLGQLLDRSFRMSPAIFRRLLPFYLLISAAAVLAQLPHLTDAHPSYAFVGIILETVLSWYTMFAGILLASELWLSNDQVTRLDIASRITWGLVGRTIWLSLVVSVGTLVGLLLLIVPGIIYLVNRLLAYYLLIIDGKSVNEAIERSKSIMKLGKWYRSTSPVFRISIVALATMVIGGSAGVVIGGVSAASAAGTVGAVATVIVLFVGSLVAQFVKIFSFVAYTGVYYDAKARFEGADIVETLDLDTLPRGGIAQ